MSFASFTLTPLKPIKITQKPAIGLLKIQFFSDQQMQEETFSLGDCADCARGAAVKDFLGLRIEGNDLRNLKVLHKASSGIPVHECSKNELHLYQSYSCKFKTNNKVYHVLLNVAKNGHPEQSKVIFINAKGPTPALTKEFNEKFFLQANKKPCWSSGDMNNGKNIFGNLCVKFLPYEGKKLAFNRNWFQQDLRLDVAFDKKNYHKHFFCSDGLKDFSCSNMGEFDIPDKVNLVDHIVSELMTHPTTLGAK